MALMPVHRDAVTSSFFDGTARGEFLLVRDGRTGELLDPKTDTSFDRARFERVPAGGGATVVSWSVPHTRLPSGETKRTIVGIVQLDEGPWWWTEIVGFDPDEDLTGARVHVEFEPSGEDEGAEAIPLFVKS